MCENVRNELKQIYFEGRQAGTPSRKDVEVLPVTKNRLNSETMGIRGRFVYDFEQALQKTKININGKLDITKQSL